MFSDDVAIYVENSKESTENYWNKLASIVSLKDNKVNIQKSIVFQDTNNEEEEHEITTTVPFMLVTKMLNTKI